MAITFNHNDKLYVSGSNVGIGTNDPQRELHIKGDTWAELRLDGQTFASGHGATLEFYSEGTALADIYASTDKHLYFRTNGTNERMRITSGGSVGIGTTNPNKRLSVETNDTATYSASVNASEISIARKNSSNTAGQVAAISLNATGWSGQTTGVVVLNAIARQGNFSNADFAIQNRVGGNFVETFRITTYGNVGIGTDTPDDNVNTGNYFKPDGGGRFLTVKDSSGSFIMLESSTTTDDDQIGGIYFNNTGGQADAHLHVAGIDAILHKHGTNDALSGGDLRFFTKPSGSGSNGPRMVILENGNVGIGTTSPSYKLHVDGNVGITEYLQHSGDNNTYLRFSGDMVRLAAGGVEMIRLHEDATQDTLVINEGGADVDFRVESDTDTHALFVQGSDGNVGIGTGTPDAPLTVHSSTDPEIRFGYSSTQDHRIQWDSSKVFIHADPENANASSAIALYVDGGAKLYIPDSGNVGIGTTSPSSKLHISGATDESIIRLQNTATSLSLGDTIGALQFYNSDTTDDSPNIAASIYATAGPSGGSGYLSFRTTEAGTEGAAATATMTLTNGGNVGIGTTTPVTGLDVRTSTYSNTTARFGETRPIYIINDEPIIGFNQYYDSGWKAGSSGYSGYIGMKPSNGDMYFRLSTQSNAANAAVTDTTPLYILNNGNVGIGTTAPDAPLHILKAAGGANIVAGLKLDPDDATANSGISIDFNASTTNTGASLVGSRIVGAREGGNASGFLALYTSPDASGSVPLERMRITSGGNVGIGTASVPSEANLSLGAKTTTEGGHLVINKATSSTHATHIDNNTDTFRIMKGTDSASGSVQFILNHTNGNVGIGTTSPSSRLHINKENALSVLTISRGGTNLAVSTDIGSIEFKADYQGSPISYGNIKMYSNSLSGVRSSLDFNVKSASGSVQTGLTVQGNSGTPRVGIGTTGPDAKLDVEGGALGNTSGNSTTAAIIRAGRQNLIFKDTRTADGTDWNNATFKVIAAIDSTSHQSIDFVNDSGYLEHIDLRVGNQAFSTRFASNGNVGIGTDSPVNKLNVNGDIGYIGVIGQGNIYGNTGNSSYANMQLYNPATGYSTFNNQSYGYYFNTSGGTKLTILNNGNVGIGTTSPDYKLHVVGSGYFTSNVRVDDYIRILGTGHNNTGQFNFNAIYDGGQTNTYSPYWSGAANAGMTIIKMPTGGVAGLDYYVHRHGTSTTSVALSSMTKAFSFNDLGEIQFGSYGAGFLQTDANGNITAGTVTTSDTLDDVTDNGNSTTNSITVGGVTSTGGGEMQGGDLYFKNGGDDGAGTHLSNVWYSVSTGGGTAPVGVYESAVITTVANGTHGRSDIVFKTKNNNTANFGSANERMRITKEGLVGINKTAPQAYLHIDGGSYPQLLLDGGGNTTGDIVVPDGEILQIGHWNNGTTTFTGRLWLASSGHLGIGNNSPESLLHLGESVNGANIISFGDASLGGPHGLDFYGDDATRTKKFSIYYRTGTENISMEDGGGTKRWEISQSGAVTFNQAFTFPTADGSTGAALVTNGSGSLSWNAGYQQYTPVGWGVLNNQTYTSTGSNISSNSTQAQAGTTPVQRNSATEFEATKAGWYEISYSFIVKNNYTNRAMIGAYMTVSTSGGGGVISGSHSTQYVRYNTYGEYAQIQNTFYYYTSYSSTNFYLLAYLLSGSMNMTTQSISQSMISFRYINNDIT